MNQRLERLKNNLDARFNEYDLRPLVRSLRKKFKLSECNGHFFIRHKKSGMTTTFPNEAWFSLDTKKQIVAFVDECLALKF